MAAQFQFNIDQNAAIAHLAALRCKPEEEICLRFFYPPDDPRKAEDKGINRNCKFPHLPWELLELI